MTKTTMTKSFVYPPANVCIYCGEIKPPLTDEHIIPRSIGGQLILPNASCAGCQNETHAFEGHACDSFRIMRRILGFPTRNRGRKSEAKKREEKFLINVDGRRIKIDASEFPALLTTLSFPFPGILLNAPKKDVPLAGQVHAINLLPDFGDKLNHIKAKFRAESVSLIGGDKYSRIDQSDFGRMLAKIAHSYAAAELGIENFNPYLLDTIAGRGPYFLPYYIGSSFQMIGTENDLHEITMGEDPFTNSDQIIIKIRLFATYNTPTHIVVVGNKK